MHTQIFEAGMLLLFGCSWPVNITKSIRSRTAKGKSIWFEVMIFLGYTCGIIGKLIGGQVNWVLIIYFVDIAMVTTDIMLTLRNRRLDRQKEEML